MMVTIDVPDYSPMQGLRMEWEPGSRIETHLVDSAVHIRVDKAGLVSLARLMLTLGNDEVPSGSHWHLDELNALEEGSIELIVEKA